jgi:hypothetical protein
MEELSFVIDRLRPKTLTEKAMEKLSKGLDSVIQKSIAASRQRSLGEGNAGPEPIALPAPAAPQTSGPLIEQTLPHPAEHEVASTESRE